jgi:hypothetical protein
VKPDVPISVLCSGSVNSLGKVFEPGFELLTASRQCVESWQCPACDRDKVMIVTD